MWPTLRKRREGMAQPDAVVTFISSVMGASEVNRHKCHVKVRECVLVCTSHGWLHLAWGGSHAGGAAFITSSYDQYSAAAWCCKIITGVYCCYVLTGKTVDNIHKILFFLLHCDHRRRGILKLNITELHSISYRWMSMRVYYDYALTSITVENIFNIAIFLSAV